MDKNFWHERWQNGQIGFHRSEYHPMLLKFAPMHINDQSKVLVPLCGKTRDLIWLKDCCGKVSGIELSRIAAEEFFKENLLEPLRTEFQIRAENLEFNIGDIFDETILKKANPFDFIYDRAALVALPPEMRPDYSRRIAELCREGAKILLISFEYDQKAMPGPPFSVSMQEIRELYQEKFELTPLDEIEFPDPGGRFKERGLEQMKEFCVLLTKKY